MFKFEAMWLENPDIERVVENGWSIQVERSGSYQLVQKLKKSKSDLISWSKNGLMAIKIDLEKAYDRVRWDFLRDTLVVFGPAVD